VSADDVKVLATEAEVDAKAAERRLRECGGDLEAALASYL
jgi:NACalpha-BTF3-like transcription factor